MKIKQLSFENFFSYESASINLENRGLVLVDGKNGAGKSAIFDAILWTLYNRTVRYGVSNARVSRKRNGNCRAVISVEVDGLNIDIQRHRDHQHHGNKTILLIDGVDKSRATETETQNLITKYLSIDQETFQACVMFPQGTIGFPEYSDATQKTVLETILGTSRFTEAYALCAAQKSRIEAAVNKINADSLVLTKQVDTQSLTIQKLAANIKEWDFQKRLGVSAKETVLTEHLKTKPNVPDLSIITDQIQSLSGLLKENEFVLLGRERNRLVNIITDTTAKLNQLQGILTGFGDVHDVPPPELVEQSSSYYLQDLSKLNSQHSICLATIQRLQTSFKQKEASIAAIDSMIVCTHCDQPLSVTAKEAFYGTLRSERAEIVTQLNQATVTYNAIMQELPTLKTNYEKALAYETWQDGLTKVKQANEYRTQISSLQAIVTSATEQFKVVETKLLEIQNVVSKINMLTEQKNAILVLFSGWEAKLTQLTEQLEAEKLKTNPFSNMLASEKQEHKALDEKLHRMVKYYQDMTDVLKTYEFWYEGFSNRGVKSLLLDSVTPFLTERANFYIKLLTDSEANVTFSTQSKTAKGEDREKFNVSSSYMYGSPDYEGSSGGEAQRVNVACMFALGDLVSARTNEPIALRLLDEPFESLDTLGKEYIVRILKEHIVPNSKTVLVMTHDDDLKSLFDTRIQVIKDGASSFLIQD